MSVDYFKSVLESLESLHEKLDRLLAVGSARQTEKKEDFKGRFSYDYYIEEASGGEKEGEVLRQHSVVDQQIKAEERFDSVADSKLPEDPIDDEGFVIGNILPKEEENAPIVWIKHDGKKFKVCKYKCGNYVGWDNTTKKYLHYDAGFKLIGHECPKYATSGAFD